MTLVILNLRSYIVFWVCLNLVPLLQLTLKRCFILGCPNQSIHLFFNISRFESLRGFTQASSGSWIDHSWAVTIALWRLTFDDLVVPLIKPLLEPLLACSSTGKWLELWSPPIVWELVAFMFYFTLQWFLFLTLLSQYYSAIGHPTIFSLVRWFLLIHIGQPL